MTDLPYILVIQLRGDRNMPLNYYTDLALYGIPEAQKSVMLDKLQILRVADTAISAPKQKHGFCCRLLGKRSCCNCPWEKPVFRPLSTAVGSSLPGQGLKLSIVAMESYKLMESNITTLYKPLHSGLYKWTQINFTRGTECRGFASGIVEDGCIHVEQYWS